MHDFVRKLITEWRRLELPVDGATVVIALSGGADSLSLMLAMQKLQQSKKLGLRLVVAHLNHGLRDGESDADEEFIRKIAINTGTELAVGKGKISREGNLEQNARIARYQFLKDTAQNVNADLVLTGHTMNDQAETFLMNLIRGSGPDGLSGMRSKRLLASQAVLVRPLLTWAKRLDTEGYCRFRGIEYRYDTMNEDTAFKRVRIRKILLPLLEDLNPRIIETLSNTADLMQNLSEPLETRNRSEIKDEFVVADLKLLVEGDRQRMIRDWLRLQRGNTRRLALKHIEAISRLVVSEKSGRTVELPGGQVVKSGGSLVYKENKVEKKGLDI